MTDVPEGGPGELVSEDHLMTMIRESEGSDANVCIAIYKLIAAAETEHRSSLLRTACEAWEARDGSEKDVDLEVPNSVSETEAEATKSKFDNVIETLLQHTATQGVDEPTFYEALLNLLENPVFPSDDNTRGIVLWQILDSKYIPYFVLPNDALRMSDSDYKEMRKALSQELAKISFILSRPHTQRTEDADLVLREILAEPDPSRRIVLMTGVVQAVHAQATELLIAMLGMFSGRSD